MRKSVEELGTTQNAKHSRKSLSLLSSFHRVTYLCSRESKLLTKQLSMRKARSPTVKQPDQGDQLVHYDHYVLSRFELIQSLAMWGSLLVIITYSLYQSILFSLLISPLAWLMLPYSKKRLIAKRKLRMKLQLKDILMSLVSSLAVGRSLENCFAVAGEDMAMLYPQTKTELIQELSIINHRISNGESIEQSLHKLAQRANIEELSQFVEALQTCKRSGGDLLNVMRRTSTMLGDQIAIDNEIQVLIAQKKLEGRMMMAAPFVFLQFLHSMSPDYMVTLQSTLGYIILTTVLILLLLLFWIMDKIITIRM